MADDHARDALLNRLQAQLAAQQERLDRLERPRRRVARRLLPLALVALLAVLTPLAVAADFAFLDLNSGSPHNDNIAAIKAAGITKGCNPPAYDNYCPNGTVTREEMASFLARTAGLGANPPVANALTAVSATNASHATAADTATTATTAVSAANAATVGGYGAPQLARVGTGTGATSLTTITADLNSRQQVATVTLAIPGPGYVLVNGAVIGVSAGAGCSSNCTLVAQLHDLGGGSAAVSPYLVTLLGTDTSNYRTLSPTAVFPVTAGQRTFALEVYAGNGGQGNEKYFNPTITALFVPFGPTGATP